MSTKQLTAVARTHAAGRRAQLPDAPDYDDLCSRLLGLALVSASGCPASAALPDLQNLATCLTVMLTHRARFDAEEVALLAAPYRDLLPALEAELNEPH